MKDARATAGTSAAVSNWVTVACPDCGAPAEVEHLGALASTNEWVEHVKVRCVSRHWFLMPTFMLD